MRFEILSTDENVTRPVPILFVHRAWHAAWCWENFLPYFSRQGYASCAVSLRGHGTSDGRDKIRWHSAVHGYVSDVEQVVHTFIQCPGPGRSFSGRLCRSEVPGDTHRRQLLS